MVSLVTDKNEKDTCTIQNEDASVLTTLGINFPIT